MLHVQVSTLRRRSEKADVKTLSNIHTEVEKAKENSMKVQMKDVCVFKHSEHAQKGQKTLFHLTRPPLFCSGLDAKNLNMT